MGLALSPQTASELSGKQACSSLRVSEYSYVLEACKSFDVKSWLHLNSLFQHFQVFACFWGGGLLKCSFLR